MQYTSRAAQLYRQQLTKDSAKLTALAAADAVSESVPLPALEPAASNGAAAAPPPAENGSAAASGASAAAAAPVAAAPAPGEEPVYARFTYVLLREGWMRNFTFCTSRAEDCYRIVSMKVLQTLPWLLDTLKWLHRGRSIKPLIGCCCWCPQHVSDLPMKLRR